jgi:hypothetical protein
VLFSLVQYDASSVSMRNEKCRGCICKVTSSSAGQGHRFYGARNSRVCIHQIPSMHCILCQLSQVTSHNRRFLKGSEKDLALWNGLHHRSVCSNAVVRCRVGSLAIKGTPCVLISSFSILSFHLQLCVTTGVLHVTCMHFLFS